MRSGFKHTEATKRKMSLSQQIVTSDQVFDAIVAYKQTHDGLSPSFRELTTLLGGSHTSHNLAYRHVHKLAKAGRVILKPTGKNHIGIMIPNGKWTLEQEKPRE